MQCTNVLTWELNRYGQQRIDDGQRTTDDGRQTTDDRRQTTHFKSFKNVEEDRVDNKEMKIVHCPAEEMWADVLTKPLQGKAF